MMNAGQFTARWYERGIWVSNLGNQRLLPWTVFETVIELGLEKEVGVRINKGNAMGRRLGEVDLELDTVEGKIAHRVFGKQPGMTVFRRVSPVVGILVWSGIFRNGQGFIVLNE